MQTSTTCRAFSSRRRWSPAMSQRATGVKSWSRLGPRAGWRRTVRARRRRPDGEGGAGAGARSPSLSNPGGNALLPSTTTMTITVPTSRMLISNQCYNGISFFWSPCHVLGKCGRDYCPYFTDKKLKLVTRRDKAGGWGG